MQLLFLGRLRFLVRVELLATIALVFIVGFVGPLRSLVAILDISWMVRFFGWLSHDEKIKW